MTSGGSAALGSWHLPGTLSVTVGRGSLEAVICEGVLFNFYGTISKEQNWEPYLTKSCLTVCDRKDVWKELALFWASQRAPEVVQ